ncbi:hypothetical protein HDU96_000070 [Phlyctochytrium bullatum]|nr:hypothetical protein HDU96_000070 [Phlyctochytrium bullatum]
MSSAASSTSGQLASTIQDVLESVVRSIVDGNRMMADFLAAALPPAAASFFNATFASAISSSNPADAAAASPSPAAASPLTSTAASLTSWIVNATHASTSDDVPFQNTMYTLFGYELSLAELCMIFAPIACYWVYSTLLYVLSVCKFTAVELHRIPIDQPRRPKNRVTVRKVLWTVLLQHVVQAIVALVVVLLTRPENIATWRMEPLWLVGLKFWIATLVLDTWQYWMHRWMHLNPWLYRNFHSVHHQLTAPYAYGALYNHPVEGLIMDTVGGALPSLLMDMHPWTSALFYCVATLKTVDDHCGYHWPWSPFKLIGKNDAEYHDIHHWGKGIKYNFSQPFYTFWDRFMGTEYHAAMAKKEKEAKEKELAAAAAVADADADAAEEVKKVPAAAAEASPAIRQRKATRA